MLARPPEEIRLVAVVEAIDGWRDFQRCVLGLEPCGPESPCPLHDEWAGIKEALRRMFSEKTLRELAEELAEGRTSLRSDRTVPGPYIV